MPHDGLGNLHSWRQMSCWLPQIYARWEKFATITNDSAAPVIFKSYLLPELVQCEELLQRERWQSRNWECCIYVCVCVWGRNSQQVSADHLQCLLTTPWSGHATTLQLPYVMWNDRKRVTQPFLHLSPSEWMFAGRVISAMCIFARLHVCLSAASRQMAKF